MFLSLSEIVLFRCAFLSQSSYPPSPVSIKLKCASALFVLSGPVMKRREPFANIEGLVVFRLTVVE